MMTHENKRQEHLGSEPPNERSGESNKSVRLYELIQVDAHQLHCNTEVIPEVEMVVHLDNVMFLVGILKSWVSTDQLRLSVRRTHLRKLSKILISTRA